MAKASVEHDLYLASVEKGQAHFATGYYGDPYVAASHVKYAMPWDHWLAADRPIEITVEVPL